MRTLLPLFFFFFVTFAFAAESPDELVKVLDKNPVLGFDSASRGDGATLTSVQGLEAGYENPARIGAHAREQSKKNWVKQFHFPYLAFSLNENATSLNQEFSQSGGASDRGVGKAIVESAKGKRQFLRSSMAFNALVGRLLWLSYLDTQLACIPQDTLTVQGEQEILGHYAQTAGMGVGASISDSQGVLTLGAFTSVEAKSIFLGRFSYSEIINIADRQRLLSENSSSYSGGASHVGILWRISKSLQPTLAVVMRHLGDSQYRSSTSSRSEPLIYPQQLGIGFSIAPQWSRRHLPFHAEVSAQDLLAENVSLSKKWHISVGQSFSAWNEEDFFSLQTGFDHAGASAGAHLRLGILHAGVAVSQKDISEANKTLKENRMIVIAGVDLAE